MRNVAVPADRASVVVPGAGRGDESKRAVPVVRAAVAVSVAISSGPRRCASDRVCRRQLCRDDLIAGAWPQQPRTRATAGPGNRPGISGRSKTTPAVKALLGPCVERGGGASQGVADPADVELPVRKAR